MSLHRTFSVNKIPEQSVDQPKEQQEVSSPDSKNKQNTDTGGADHSTLSSKSSTTEQSTSAKKKNLVKLLKPPVVRQKLTQRERSISSPVIHRPLPSSSNPNSSQAEIASSPRLKSKRSDETPKLLTQQQQLASDLADLMEKVLLRRKGRLDDQADISQATLNLQRQVDKKEDGKVSIHNLTLKIFADDLKKTEAWSIAQEIITKIRINYLKGQDSSNELDPIKKAEMTGMLNLFAASFAGAFFNISGKGSTTRLPDSLIFFLREIDYRQIRILLSDDKSISMSQENFLRLRKEWMAEVLIDAFIVPLVQKEFFTIRGTLPTDQVVSQLISALHNAFAISAPAILSESLKSAPEDIINLEAKRRTTQFKPRVSRLEKSPKNYQKAQQKSISPSRSILGETTSPSRKRRTELSDLLKNLTDRLAKENAHLTPAMLTKIKAFNNDFALTNQPISKAFLYPAWLATLEDEGDKKGRGEKPEIEEDHSDALKVLKGIVDDVVAGEKEQKVLEHDLLEIDIFTKLTEIEKSGKSINIERANRLSSNMPLNPIGVSAPLSHISPTTVSPRTISPTKFVPSSSSTPPKSPTALRLQEHRRVKTADAMSLTFQAESKGLTEQERNALVNAYPDLLLSGIQRVAYKKVETALVLKNDPIKEIITTGRDKFLIPLDRLTKVLREKIQKINSLPDDETSISHAALLKILMLEDLRSSEAGKSLLSIRTQALKSAESSKSNISLADQPSLKAEKDRLLAIFKLNAEQLTGKLFNPDLSKSYFPPSLLTLWKNFDQKLVDWAENDLKKSVENLENLRSALGFDLIVTRLIYPLCIGIGDATPSLAATSFADAVRLSTLQNWDPFFQAFKQA
jgi:hypothetical protein